MFTEIESETEIFKVHMRTSEKQREEDKKELRRHLDQFQIKLELEIVMPKPLLKKENARKQRRKIER